MIIQTPEKGNFHHPRGFLPSEIRNALDMDHLSVDKKSYLSEDYKEHFTDLVLRPASKTVVRTRYLSIFFWSTKAIIRSGRHFSFCGTWWNNGINLKV